MRDETINRGHRADASPEAQSLLAFYNAHASFIQTFTTQVGSKLAAYQATDPDYRTPHNLGELSIQSLLIDLQMRSPGDNPVVLFEDHWFLSNSALFVKSCTLLALNAPGRFFAIAAGVL